MSSSLRTGTVLFVKDLAKVAKFYEKVAGLSKTHAGEDHIVLKSGSYELVVHAIPEAMAGPGFIESPLVIREDCTVKLVFFIKSISSARRQVVRLGGLLQGTEREWQYNGTVVCDGCDPEGHVVQFRQRNTKRNPLKRRRAV